MKLSKALAAHNLAETCDVVITPGVFTVRVIRASGDCQAYNAKVAAFAAINPNHPIGKPDDPFWRDLTGGALTADTWPFLRDVLLSDWDLTDDDGNAVPMTPEAVDEVLGADHAGRLIAAKLLRAALTPGMFQVELILKN